MSEKISQEVREANRKYHLRITRKWMELIIVIVFSLTDCIIFWNNMIFIIETADSSIFFIIATGGFIAILLGLLVIPLDGYFKGNKEMTKKDRLNFFEYVWYEYENIFFLPFPLIIFTVAAIAILIRMFFI